MVIGGQSSIHVLAWWIKALVVDPCQGIVARRQIHQANGMQPILTDLFQPNCVLIIQTSGDAVEDEDRQKAKDILDCAHDDSFK